MRKNIHKHSKVWGQYIFFLTNYYFYPARMLKIGKSDSKDTFNITKDVLLNVLFEKGS